jgi:hypothetical protein
MLYISLWQPPNTLSDLDQTSTATVNHLYQVSTLTVESLSTTQIR